MKKLQFALIPLILLLGAFAVWWILQQPAGQTADPHGHAHGDEPGHGEHDHDKAAHDDAHTPTVQPREGPRGGKLLGDDHFAVEVTIYEEGVPPQFRVFAYHDGRLLPAAETKVIVELRRLDGETSTFSFRPEGDALVGEGVVAEPHSFEVTVRAEHDGETHTWTYASPEGRTVIPAATARESGLATAIAGTATISDQLVVHGLIQPDAERVAVVAPRFGGLVKSVPVRLGDHVEAGAVLATVQNNETLATYEVTAPFAGTILAKSIAPGAVAGPETSFTLMDLTVVWAEFQVFQRDLGRVRPGQRVTFTTTGGEVRGEGVIAWMSPVGSPATQSVTARVVLANADGRWAPGLAITGTVHLGLAEVPLAVRTEALQSFRDFTVVFAQVGDTYEVRMLELGRRDARHAEVLGGLKPGTRYVTANSFLVKADIEKSGASHDH
jgi:cobalt-zinc-cadmium efflux system membrane fusion protein